MLCLSNFILVAVSCMKLVKSLNQQDELTLNGQNAVIQNSGLDKKNELEDDSRLEFRNGRIQGDLDGMGDDDSIGNKTLNQGVHKKKHIEERGMPQGKKIPQDPTNDELASRENDDLKALENWNDANHFMFVPDEADHLEKEYSTFHSGSLDQGVRPEGKQMSDYRQDAENLDMTDYIDGDTDGDRLINEYTVDVGRGLNKNLDIGGDALAKEYDLGEDENLHNRAIRQHPGNVQEIEVINNKNRKKTGHLLREKYSQDPLLAESHNRKVMKIERGVNLRHSSHQQNQGGIRRENHNEKPGKLSNGGLKKYLKEKRSVEDNTVLHGGKRSVMVKRLTQSEKSKITRRMARPTIHKAGLTPNNKVMKLRHGVELTGDGKVLNTATNNILKTGDDLGRSDKLPEMFHYFLKFSQTQKYFMILNVTHDACPYFGGLLQFLRTVIDNEDSDLDVQMMDVMFEKAFKRMIVGLQNFGADLDNKENFVTRHQFPDDIYGFKEILPKAKNQILMFSRMRKSLWYFDDYGSVELFIQKSVQIQRECSMLDPVNTMKGSHEFLFMNNVISFVKKLKKAHFMIAERPYWATYLLYLGLVDCMVTDVSYVLHSICNHVLAIASKSPSQAKTSLSNLNELNKAELKHTSSRRTRSSDTMEGQPGNYGKFHNFTISNATTEKENAFENVKNGANLTSETLKVNDTAKEDENDNPNHTDIFENNSHDNRGKSGPPSNQTGTMSRSARSSGCSTTYELRDGYLSLNGVLNEAETIEECQTACEDRKRCLALDYGKRNQLCSLHFKETYTRDRIPYEDYKQYEIENRC